MSTQIEFNDRPQVQASLDKLKRELQNSGYDPSEVGAIVDGAREHVEELIASDPTVSDHELAEYINAFSNPELAPSNQPSTKGSSLVGAAALASGVLGILIMVGAFNTTDPDLGGALMLLATLLGGGIASALGFLSRRTQTGLIALVIGAALWLCLIVFVLLASD